MRRCLYALAGVVACTPFGASDGEPAERPSLDGGEDGRADAVAPGADGGACRQDAPFGSPQLVPLSTDADESAMRISADGTTFYVSKGPIAAGESDLFFAKRLSATDPIPTGASLTPLDVLSGPGEDKRPTITPDEKEIYFESTRAGGVGAAGSYDIWMSSRPDATTWTVPVSAPDLNTTADDREPYLLPGSGTVMYFTSTRGAGGISKIFRSSRKAPSGWSTPIEVGGLTSSDDDGSPVVADDELTLYFTRSRGTGDRDMFVARRLAKTDAFGTPTPIDELNTTVEDRPTFLSSDGCTLYFTSIRIGSGPLGYNLYRAIRRQ